METKQAKSIAVGVTGASGAIYAVRTIAALLERGCNVDVVVSEFGRRLLRDELGESAAIGVLETYLRDTYGSTVGNGTIRIHSNKDVGATIASGSYVCAGMVIVPCSMKTLAGVANGLSRNLVERAADVVLCELKKNSVSIKQL